MVPLIGNPSMTDAKYCPNGFTWKRCRGTIDAGPTGFWVSDCQCSMFNQAPAQADLDRRSGTYSYSRYIRKQYAAERTQMALFWRNFRRVSGPLAARQLWRAQKKEVAKFEKRILEEGNTCLKLPE